MALPDPYTIPEMELTLEPDGRVRITMKSGYVGAFSVVTRRTARHLLMTLALAVPEWLRDD